MRKILIAVILSIALMLPLSAFGAGSCTPTQDKLSDGFVVVKLVCTGDSGDGSIPKQSVYNSSIAANTGAIYLYQVKAYPTVGGTAPDAADITVNMDNLDLLGGKGVNLIHATATYDTLPYSTFMAAYRFPAITHGVSVAVANQGTASANYTIELIFVK
jgi:hypothetical protein